MRGEKEMSEKTCRTEIIRAGEKELKLVKELIKTCIFIHLYHCQIHSAHSLNHSVLHVSLLSPSLSLLVFCDASSLLFVLAFFNALFQWSVFVSL